MKLAQSLGALIITGSASFVIPFALASFHVATIRIDEGVGSDASRLLKTLACPAYLYHCLCFVKNNRDSVGVIPGPFDGQHNVSIVSGLCGMGKLNLFKNSDGSWYIYVDKGNGTIVGTCYPNTAYLTCNDGVDTTIVDNLVCYSNICQD